MPLWFSPLITFAWVAPSETTFGPEHEVVDENVLSLRIGQREGEFATAEIEVVNPRVGLLGPGRKVWAWIGYDDGSTSGVTALFFGRLLGQPAELAGNTLRLEFQARPADFEAQKASLAESLKAAPYWDPVWVDPEALDDPDQVLAARNGRWHIDRVSHAVTVSDMTAGEDGTFLLGGGGEATLLYDPLSAAPVQPPVKKVRVTGSVQWEQAAAGSLDLAPRLIAAFQAAGASKPHAITSHTGEGLERDWPETGDPIGSGWRVGTSSLRRLDGNAIQQGFHRVAMASGGVIGGDAQVDFPLWTFAPVFTLAYEARRARRETISFTLAAATQDLATDAGEEEVRDIELSSFALAEPLDDLGTAGFTAPLRDARRPSYFLTDRGKQSLEYLLALARAELLEQARAVEVTATTRFEDGLDLSCRISARITDPRLPGGVATGKIVAYELSIDGDSGAKEARLTIGCSVGRGTSVNAAAGTPGYVEDGYVEAGWQTRTGAVVVPIAGVLGYTDYDDQGPPNDGVADDGVDFLALNPAAALVSLQVLNGEAAQKAVLDAGYTSLAVAAEALNAAFTEVDVSLVPLETGPFAHEIAVSVEDLAVPKTIDLEAV